MTDEHATSTATAAALHGLSATEAAVLMAAEGPNELPRGRDRGWLAQILDVVRQPMILLLLGAASVHLILAEPLDTVLLLGSVLLVIAISVGQEHRTESALDALRDLSSPRALVVRRNPVLPWILGGAALLLVAVLGVPGLRGALGFGPLDVRVALVAGAAASAGILWFEGWKGVSRRRAGS